MAKAVTAAPTVQGTPSPPGTTAGGRKKKWAAKVKTGCLTCRFASLPRPSPLHQPLLTGTASDE